MQSSLSGSDDEDVLAKGLARRAQRFCTKIAAIHYARRFCGNSEFFVSLADTIDAYLNGPLTDFTGTNPEALFASVPDIESVVVVELERLTSEIAGVRSGPAFPVPPEPGATVEEIQIYAETTVQAVSDHNAAIIRRSHDIELIGKILVAFAVSRSRESDASWSIIGSALDMTAQAAHKKFSSSVADELLAQLEKSLK